MTTLTRNALCLALLASAPAALAQPRPPTLRPLAPPGAEPLRPALGDRQIAPQAPVAGEQPPPAAGVPPARKGPPSCEEVRRKARYNIYFDKVEIEKLVQTVSDATCKTFILPENVRGKISIIGPENGKVEVDADQFYAAFLAALDANSLSVYQHGKFLKIVDKQRAKQFPIPTVLDPEETFTTNEQMMTRLFKVRYVEIEQLRGVLQQLVTPSGDTIPFQPDTIIVNDLASNMKRLERIVDQLDSRSSSDEIKVLQIQYATAQEIADKIQKLFESKSQRPGQRPGNIAPLPATPAPGAQPAAPAAGATGAAAEGTGPATLSQLIPDERTNKLVIIASPAAMDRILALIREFDIPISGEGRINVYPLENANAEDLASTLQSLAQGTANRPKTGGAPPPGAAAKGPTTAAELFQGEVKISADKGTNSLVVIASQNDYRSLIRVIEKLDTPRRQVFVEAVIMEVNLDRSLDLGLNLHGGVPLKTDQGTLPLVFGTKYSKGAGAPPSLSLAGLLSLGGFLAGVQGPTIAGLSIAGQEIPSWGVMLNALQTSSDVNVLSTPHLLTSDNEEAEISVGQNVPFQAGFSPSSLGGLASSVPGANPALASGLGGLGGLGSFFAPIQRQNVELKLTVKPQINESDYVRMVINEQTEEIASRDAVLGPTTAKRTAKTTVVAKDQETVVIGGIMQEREIESISKVPFLGDIPLLGNLFRTRSTQKLKTNLLLFLTPYIIKDSSDFRRIFERKLKERQQFVEQFYGSTSGYDVAIDFSRKPGPLGRMTQILNKELNKVENGGPGEPGTMTIRPGGSAPALKPDGTDTTSPAETGKPMVPGPNGANLPPPGSSTAAPTESKPAPAQPNETPPVERLQVQP